MSTSKGKGKRQPWPFSVWVEFASAHGEYGSEDEYELRNAIEDAFGKELSPEDGDWAGHGQGMGQLDFSHQIRSVAVARRVLPLALRWPVGLKVQVRVLDNIACPNGRRVVEVHERTEDGKGWQRFIERTELIPAPDGEDDEAEGEG